MSTLWREALLEQNSFAYRQMTTASPIQTLTELHLQPCKHQVAGHLFEEGKAGSLVDEKGHFYKPVQNGPRGRRERDFYERVRSELRSENAARLRSAAQASVCEDVSDEEDQASVSGRSDDESDAQAKLPFSVRNAAMLVAVPRFFGVVEMTSVTLLELEDVAKRYRHPSIIDIKLGFQTWYPTADQRYIDKCKAKDASTTQAALGFKICGMQVYRACQRGYWRASKRWCKQLPQDAVNKALIRFANNEAGLRPIDIFGGRSGSIAQLQQLEQWFQTQREFFFYSSSVLIVYEGDAESAEEARVTIKLVDFAHTFASDGRKDTNFVAGITALIDGLTNVLTLDYHDCLM